jgi:hypothetical protein
MSLDNCPIVSPSTLVSPPLRPAGVKRTYSCRELTALRRERVYRQHTQAPSINLQDSSEATARARKMASVLPEHLPSRGNSTNMVKYRDCSVVQSMRAGAIYRQTVVNRVPRVRSCTVNQVPNPFLDSTTSLYDKNGNPYNTVPFLVHTTPKVVVYPQPEKGDIRVYQAFDLVDRFGMRKNDNKVVMAAIAPVPPIPCVPTVIG